MCSLCKNHNYKVPIKNHKYICPYSKCLCVLCMLVREKNVVMARQIALRRKQKSINESSNCQTQSISENNQSNCYLTKKQKLLLILQKLFPKLSKFKLENLLQLYNYKVFDILEFLVLQ